MRRIAILFWLGVLITVCCGCRWCGTDLDRSLYYDFEPTVK